MSSEFDMATVDRLLTTTRSVRKRLDLERPVERDVIEECLRIGLQAATGSNAQRYRWIVVSDAEKRRALGELYERAFRQVLEVAAGTAKDTAAIHSGEGNKDSKNLSEQMVAQQKLMDSVMYLLDHIGEVPIHIVGCLVGRFQIDAAPAWVSSAYGSIFPAVWNLCLALRSRGLGTCLTTAHLGFEKEAAEILNIPYDRLTQVCLLPVAYYTGEGFRPGKRRPMDEVVFWEEFDPDTLTPGQW
jgi:nitroreductase